MTTQQYTIEYDRLTRDYSLYVWGEYAGSFRNHADADAAARTQISAYAQRHGAMQLAETEASEAADRADLVGLLAELALDADGGSERNAYSKAAFQVACGVTARPIDGDTLLVPSANGSTVYLSSPVTCTCAAFEKSDGARPCWHRALATAVATRSYLRAEFAWDCAAQPVTVATRPAQPLPFVPREMTREQRAKACRDMAELFA
jgi:hypothetical protein